MSDDLQNLIDTALDLLTAIAGLCVILTPIAFVVLIIAWLAGCGGGR